jgi:hypothetical protein
MRQLVKQGRVVGLGRRARRGADEGLARGQLNAVGRGAIKGAIAAVMDGRAGPGDEGPRPARSA